MSSKLCSGGFGKTALCQNARVQKIPWCLGWVGPEHVVFLWVFLLFFFCTDLPREAIGPQGFNWSVPGILRKSIATM